MTQPSTQTQHFMRFSHEQGGWVLPEMVLAGDTPETAMSAIRQLGEKLIHIADNVKSGQIQFFSYTASKP